MKKACVVFLCLLMVCLFSATAVLSESIWAQGNVVISTFTEHPREEDDTALTEGFHRVNISFRHPERSYSFEELQAMDPTVALYDSAGQSFEMLGWSNLVVNFVGNTIEYDKEQPTPQIAFAVPDDVSLEDLTLYFGPKDDASTIHFAFAELAANPTPTPEDK